MSEQRFTTQFREALWEAHWEKCIYCKKCIEYKEMRVDHIMPEATLKNCEKWEQAKKRFSLKVDFDILGYGNLAPSCEGCNGRKSNLELAPGYINILLAEISNRIGRLNELIDKKRQSRDLGNILKLIERSYEAGKFTESELKDGLDSLRRHPNGIFGSSPLAPPASPELRAQNVLFGDRSRISWTPKAHESLQNYRLGSGKLVERIFEEVEYGSLNIRKLQGLDGSTYVLRLGSETRVAFRVSGQEICILSIHSKRRIIAIEADF